MLNKIMVILLMLAGAAAFAEPEPSELTLTVLGEQMRILDRLEPTVERIDLARLKVIRRAIEEVAGDIERNKKEGRAQITFQTMRLLQYLIVQYRYSQVFLGWEEKPSLLSIWTGSTSEDLQKLRDSYQRLQANFGIDDTPYTKVTSHYFRQLEKLMRQLENLPIEESLKKSLRDMLPTIARTIAVAEQGDRPNTFRAAKKVLPLIRALYPKFNGISGSSAGFSPVLELQGLTETYAEFAQADQPQEEEKACQ